MKRKWWIVLAAALVVIVGAFSFREALMVRLFPKVVLSGAISDVFKELESRYADSPLHLLGDALDPGGCQNVKMKLDTSTQLLGAAHYDLELQTQLGPNRILGEGRVSTGGGIMDLKLYLDEEFIALSSDSLTEGAYYGITYETFPADIRGFQLLSVLAGEETLVKWDASIAGLGELMGTSFKLPQISQGDLQRALLGALVMKPQVAAGEGRHCYSVAFDAPGSELAQKAEPYLDQLSEPLAELVQALEEDADSEIKVVFQLDTRKLTAVDVSLTYSGEAYGLTVSAEKGNTLRAELTLWDGRDLDRREVLVQTASEGDSYRESIRSTRTCNGVQSQLSAEYTWDLSTGDMVLDIVKDGKRYPIRLNLKGEGSTFTVICQEFEKVQSLLTGKEKNRSVICVLTVAPGEPVERIGDFKNISDWSVDDLLLLLKQMGSLIGIKLP